MTWGPNLRLSVRAHLSVKVVAGPRCGRNNMRIFSRVYVERREFQEHLYPAFVSYNHASNYEHLPLSPRKAAVVSVL